MKKEELKASLGRIQPREELVNSTLARIHEQQAQERSSTIQRGGFFPAVYNRGLRVAGAVCAFALVFSIGFAVAKLGGVDPTVTPVDPSARLAGTLDTDVVNNPSLAMFSLGEEEWIAVRGNVDSLRFVDLTEEQSAMGAVASAEVTIAVKSIEGRSEEFSRETINREITATVLLYDTETINALVNASTSDLLIRLMPIDNDGWDILDLCPAE